MLWQEPAGAWFTVGVADVTQSSQHLPALHKDVLRYAVKRYIETHFFLPVAGHNSDNEHINIMKMFVTFVWGYYTEYQRPKVPAMTNVGRFNFTYIWRHQNALFR